MKQIKGDSTIRQLLNKIETFQNELTFITLMELSDKEIKTINKNLFKIVNSMIEKNECNITESDIFDMLCKKKKCLFLKNF